ncbi:hypothetical protein BH09ACT13_BH09ACT13_00040 [soil metagenome]
MSLQKLGVGVLTTALFAVGLWAGIGSARWLEPDAAIALTATASAAKEVPRPTGVSARARGIFNAGLTRRGTGGTLG